MATFSQGLRFEYERASGSFTGANQTILSVPANANYFIYVREFMAVGGASFNGNFYRPSLSGLGSLSYTADSAISGSLDRNEFYFDDLATGLKQFERVIHANESLQGSGNTTYSYTVDYVKVFFGGQANY